MFCSNCGASVTEGTPFCSNCGRAVQNQPAAAPPQAAGGYNAPQQTDGKATGSLILGILSIFPFSIFAGIPAVILGHLSRKSIRESGGRLAGSGMALAGLIMGYISLAGIPLLLLLGIVSVPAALLSSGPSDDESAAARTLRTINTAQVTYSVNYPATGYAADLSKLGPGKDGDCKEPAADHACLMDSLIAGPACTSGAWCSKYGYRYSMTGPCDRKKPCSEYVIVATPIKSSSGGKSFCSTTDAVIRYKDGAISEPLSTVKQCEEWPPMM